MNTLTITRPDASEISFSRFSLTIDSEPVQPRFSTRTQSENSASIPLSPSRRRASSSVPRVA